MFIFAILVQKTNFERGERVSEGGRGTLSFVKSFLFLFFMQVQGEIIIDEIYGKI